MRPHFLDRTHELHHVAQDGVLLEGFASNNADGFEAKMNTVEESLKVGEQMIVFYNTKPIFVVEIDFDGNTVSHRLTS